MRTYQLKRSGFTLPEVLVTITLIAILAAAVVPSIVSQVKKGDPTRLGSDYVAIRGAAEQFLTDVRRYPSSISQLTTTIAVNQSPLAGTAVTGYDYAGTEVARWRGPYLNKDSAAARETGYGAKFNATFDTASLASNTVVSTSGGQRYMILSVPLAGLDSTSEAQMDQQIDDGNITTGSVRVHRGTVDTLKFLLMPVY